MTCKAADAFAVLKTDELGVVVPRGCWTYAPRHQPRHGGERSDVRPLAAFRGQSLVSCLDDLRTLYRRDFDLAHGESFDTTWMTGWAASQNFSKREGEVYRSDRLAKNAKWSVPLFDAAEPKQSVAGLVLAGNDHLPGRFARRPDRRRRRGRPRAVPHRRAAARLGRPGRRLRPPAGHHPRRPRAVPGTVRHPHGAGLHTMTLGADCRHESSSPSSASA